jgi:hypothetical protein
LAPSTEPVSIPSPTPEAPVRPAAPAAAVTFNVEIPAAWDSERVRERVAVVLEALHASTAQ